MKKRLLLTVLVFISSVFITACGDDSNSVSNNLINENPGDMAGDIANIMNENGIGMNNDTDEFAEEEGVYFWEEEPTGDESVSSDAVSDNNVSDNSVSSDEMPGQVPIEDTNNTAVEDEAAEPIAEYTEEVRPMMFVNTSGKNIDKLYISFSTGSIQNVEVLGFESLKDGKTFEYTIENIEELRQVPSLTLTVSASLKNGDALEFGQIEVIDPTHMTVILSYGKDGYFMYLE